MIRLIRDLAWSPDGCHVETITKGDYDDLPERAIEIAHELEIVGDIDNKPPEQNTGLKPEPEPEPEPEPTKKSKK